MNKNKLFILGTVAAAVLLAVSCKTFAQAENSAAGNIVGQQSVAEEPTFNVLSDKVHHFSSTLKSTGSVHYYGFTSVRGQDVLLNLKKQRHITVERYEKEGWKVVSSVWGNHIKDLQVGEDVIIRVTHKSGVKFDTGIYELVFGSYPVIKEFKLQGEANLIKVPIGYTEPHWFAAQAHKEATFEASFVDTKGRSLEGGVASFVLGFKDSYREPINIMPTSNADGKILQSLEFGRCYGGYLARDFVEYHQGYNNIWETHYRVGSYAVVNALLGNLDEPPYTYYMGHICEQRLLRSTPS